MFYIDPFASYTAHHFYINNYLSTRHKCLLLLGSQHPRRLGALTHYVLRTYYDCLPLNICFH